MNEQLGIPIVSDDSVPPGTVELREGDSAVAKLTFHPDGAISMDVEKHKPSPREEFLRGIFETWGHSKKNAAAAARAAMEKLS